jgi:hypothetical protein
VGGPSRSIRQQGDELHGTQFHAVEATADPVDEHELLSSIRWSHRHHEPTVVGELFQERCGHLLPRCGDEDDVEG